MTSGWRVLARTSAAAVVAAAVLTSCAAVSSSAGAGGGSGGTGGGSSAPSATTSLTVSASVGDGTPARTYTLTCDPTGGTHPNAAGACAELAALTAKGTDPFAPTPSDTMCNQLYGGPQTATVTGSSRGAAVKAQFTRNDGCAVDRWNRVAVLLVVKGTVLEHPIASPGG